MWRTLAQAEREEKEGGGGESVGKNEEESEIDEAERTGIRGRDLKRSEG